MKFREPHQLEANDPNSRKRRLETLLGAWRVPRFEYWARPATPPPNTELTGDDLRLWFDILRAAEPLPPRTCRAGFEAYARLLDLPVEDLKRDNAVRIVRDRVALTSKATGMPLRLHDWSLLVPERIDGLETEAILRRRFQDVRGFGDKWLAAGSWFNCTDSICLLVEEALTAATPEALMRVWQVSLALYLEYRFLPALPAKPAERLAEKLGQELLAAADQLGVETDAELLRFALGREDGPRIMPLQLPASRLARLLESERFLEHTRYRPGDSYHDTMASALARLAPDPFKVGNVLREIRPGSALLAALESIALDRPEFVAWYAFNQRFHAEGAFTLLQLAQRAHLAQAEHIDLSEEWVEAQQLGRELMLLNNQAIDWDSLVALGVHDESQAVNRRQYGVAGIDRDKAPYDGEALWRETVSDASRGPHVAQALERHFHAPGPHPDASFTFALRLLAPLRESGQGALATRLATAIVDAYVASLALDNASRSFSLLPAYGVLLAELRAALDLHGKAWRLLLRPFDPEAYLKQALDDQSTTTTSTNSPSFTVPSVLRAHAETLVALAAALGDGFEEPLHAALELYNADRATPLNVPAFSWNALQRITFYGPRPAGEPLFLAIGRLFSRVPGEPRWLEDFLRDVNEPHILGWLLAGLGSGHALYKKFCPQLLALLDALIGPDHGIVLGHALELANLLQLAAMPVQSERFARYALQILEERKQGGLDQFSRVAQAQLAVALAQQEKWSELLAFEPDRNAMVLSPPARTVENMRAVALINSDRAQEAEDALKQLLNVEPTNAMALANLTAIAAHAGKWPETVEAAKRAKETVSGSLRDDVILYEAHALEQLGNATGAVAVLAELSDDAAGREDVRAARERLMSGGRTVVPVAPAVVAASAPDTAGERVDIAIVTALAVEYEAVRRHLKAQEDAPSGQGRRANFNAWLLGEIPKANGAGTYSVVLAVARRSGTLETYKATRRTIERWNPRIVLFCGVAGGMRREGLKQGDIVISEHIWHYDHGKIVDGTYESKHREYPAHGGLVTSARAFSDRSDDWKSCAVDAPLPGHVPACKVGLIGSGDKVLEDLESEFSKAIMKARKDLQAVEMEAAGAGAAIEEAIEEGNPVPFVMIRGISDMPKDAAGAEGAGTQQRDLWKPYASAIAANFLVSWVASTTFPFAPMGPADDAESALQTLTLPQKR